MMTLAPDLRDRIKSIIDEKLQDYDVETFEVEVAEDWSGDDSIFVELGYRLTPHEFDPSVIIAVRSAVRSMLLEHGETRFPYIRHRLQDGQKVKAA